MAESLKQKRLRLLGEAERARAEAEAATAEPAAEPLTPSEEWRENLRAFAGSGLEAVPIAGPYIKGGADRLAALKRAMLGNEGETYSGELEKIQAEYPGIVERNPYAATAGSVTGATAGMMGAAGAAPTAFGAGTIAAKPLLTRAAVSGGTNAAIGATDAYLRGQNPVTGGVVGGLFGAAGPAVGDAAEGITRRALGKTASAGAPTVDQLKTQGSDLYKAARNAGVVVAPGKLGTTVDDIALTVQREGLDKTLHPRATAALARLQEAKATGKPLTLDEVETLRKVVGDAARTPDASERRVASIIIDKVDDYMDNLTPADVVSGDPNVGVKSLTEARKIWHRMRKADTINTIVENAKIDGAAKYSQAGYEHALRTGFRQLWKNPKRMRGFTQAERDAVKRVATGDPGQNLVRQIGKFAPVNPISGSTGGSIGYGLGETLLGPGGGPYGTAATWGIGGAGRLASDAMTRGNLDLVEALVRSGGQPQLPPSATAETTKRLIQALSMGAPIASRTAGE